MSAEKSYRTRAALGASLVLLLAAGLLYATKTFSSAPASDIDYFKGEWVVTIRGNPKLSFTWKVKDDLTGGWVTGVVERGGEKVSSDFWRMVGKRIERYAFTSAGAFVKVESNGWESDRLLFVGVMSDQTGETRVRETITRVSARRFDALWEREGRDGKWTAFSDEICTR